VSDPAPPVLPDSPRHIVAVCGCVHDAAGRLLLVRTAWRGWEFPGGQVELGEDLITALHREIAEESGCTVAVERLIGLYSNIGAPHILQLLFACLYVGGDLRPSAETPEVALFTPPAVRALDLRPPTRLRLEDALAAAPQVAYRVYRVRPSYRLIRSDDL